MQGKLPCKIRLLAFRSPLITYKWQFLSRLSVLRDKWRQQVRQLYWMKIWHLNSSVKIHSLSPSHGWKLSSFFLQWKAVFTHSWIEELDHKAKEKLPAVLMRLSCQLFFEWLRNCVQETIELWPKYGRETKLKSTKKRNFLALKDIFLTSPGCCLTLASSLDVLQVRFASWSVYIKEAFRYF